MTEYGAYYQDGAVFAVEQDVWKLIERAVPEAAKEGKLKLLRVGEMRKAFVSELLTEGDVERLALAGKLGPGEVLGLIGEKHNRQVSRGRALLSGIALQAFPAVTVCTNIYAAVLRWAEQHIELDPPFFCEGAPPLAVRPGSLRELMNALESAQGGN